MKKSVTLFAYQTHAHQIGSSITGYKVNDNPIEFHEIAKGDPQLPHVFYPLKKHEQLREGDFMAAICTWDSSSRYKKTFIGVTQHDEMCDLYWMYYTADEDNTMMICRNEEIDTFRNHYPINVDI